MVASLKYGQKVDSSENLVLNSSQQMPSTPIRPTNQESESINVEADMDTDSTEPTTLSDTSNMPETNQETNTEVQSFPLPNPTPANVQQPNVKSSSQNETTHPVSPLVPMETKRVEYQTTKEGEIKQIEQAQEQEQPNVT